MNTLEADKALIVSVLTSAERPCKFLTMKGLLVEKDPDIDNYRIKLAAKALIQDKVCRFYDDPMPSKKDRLRGKNQLLGLS